MKSEVKIFYSFSDGENLKGNVVDIYITFNVDEISMKMKKEFL